MSKHNNIAVEKINAQVCSADESEKELGVNAYSLLLTGLKVAPIGKGPNKEGARKRKKTDLVEVIGRNGKTETTELAAPRASKVRLRLLGL